LQRRTQNNSARTWSKEFILWFTFIWDLQACYAESLQFETKSLNSKINRENNYINVYWPKFFLMILSFVVDWKSFFHNRNKWIFYISCFYSIVFSELLAHLHVYVMSTFTITNDVDINPFPHSSMDDRDVVCYLWISIQNYMWSCK